MIIFLCMILILVFSQFNGPGADVDQAQAMTDELAKDEAVQLESLTKKAKDFFPELKDLPEIPDSNVELDLERWHTANGMRVVFKQSDAIPMVDFRLIFRAGAAVESSERKGIAKITAALNGMGAQGLSASEIASNFEALGANFSSAAYQDMAVLSLRSLTKSEYLQEGFDLFQKVVTDIHFAEEDFHRQLSRRKVALKQEVTNPGVQLRKAAYKALFPEHPYGSPSQGTIESCLLYTSPSPRD